MYADITKPPAPLPQAEPQRVADGVTLLSPLSRRGHGPGLVILCDNSTQHLGVIDGVPSPLVKWAEEGYAVVEIQERALQQAENAAKVLDHAIKALKSCNTCEPGSKTGLIAYDPKLWNKVAGVLNAASTFVGGVVYANTTDQSSLASAAVPMLCHLAGSLASAAAVPEGARAYSYVAAKSFRLATPLHDHFDYWAESLSHTRNLMFLKPLIGGPYFDLEHIWDEHTYYEFADRSVEHTMSTMVDQPYVNHVPTLTGGVGREPLTNFYRHNFIFSNSDDVDLELISRTVGIDRVVDELIYKFTHDAVVDWILPGIPPTFKKVEVPFTAVVNIRGDRLYHEHINWDQGTVLVQLGLMPQYLPFPYNVPGGKAGASFEYRVPVTGIDTAEKMRDRNSAPSNKMFEYQVRQK